MGRAARVSREEAGQEPGLVGPAEAGRAFAVFGQGQQEPVQWWGMSTGWVPRASRTRCPAWMTWLVVRREIQIPAFSMEWMSAYGSVEAMSRPRAPGWT